jgi:hypothetical protein
MVEAEDALCSVRHVRALDSRKADDDGLDVLMSDPTMGQTRMICTCLAGFFPSSLSVSATDGTGASELD